jgi:hypothetical protein
MSWIKFVKDIQIRDDCSYKDALKTASIEWKNTTGGMSNRMDYKKISNKNIKLYQNRKIVSLMVVRRPIQFYVQNFIKLVSSKPIHDELYHLYIVVNLGSEDVGYTDSVNLKIEKNEDINISSDFSFNKFDEYMNVDVKNRNLTVNEMLNRTLNRIGKYNMFDYDAIDRNCQIFVKNVLESNNMLNQKLYNFIMQDLTGLINNTIHKLTYGITSFKNHLNQLLGQGESIN